MSRRNTGAVGAPSPSGSAVRSRSIRPAERVGDTQRRRREVARPHLRVDAALEVAVAREHRDDVRSSLDRRRGHLADQRAGVADAGRAAVADEVEAELLEVGRQRRPGRGSPSPRASPARARSSPTASRRARASTALRASSPAASITLGFDVFVQLVIAAITTLPCPIVSSSAAEAVTSSSPGSVRPGVACHPSATNRPTSVAFGSGSRRGRGTPRRTSPTRRAAPPGPAGACGPAIDGSTAERSRSRISLNVGSGVAVARNSPCSFV